RNKSIGKKGKYWVSSGNRIYSFEKGAASDNDKQIVTNLKIFHFSPDDLTLQGLTEVDKARWNTKQIQFLTKPNIISKSADRFAVSDSLIRTVEEDFNPFDQTIVKPSHLSISETKERIKTGNSETDRLTYSISLQKKYSTPFLPLVIILFTVPFALSLSRKGNVITLGYAVAIWLLYMGITNIFEQFGVSGYLSPSLAVWSPLALFAIFGLYLITRVRT
ncbi:MAG: LptF/LptG family permease, partial [Pyrinomonadaceae bacterium]|nr:LptF/LptG family permease [Pyrinomonadaceae bacterium]